MLDPGVSQDAYLRDKGSRGMDAFPRITFPAMPETIELVRKATYTVSTAPGAPDGIGHVYASTSVLEIPFGFKLHAFDKQHCPQGAKTILEVAGLLHSLVLPSGEVGASVIARAAGERGSVVPGDSITASRTASGGLATYAYENPYRPPTACVLSLMLTGVGELGIYCQGYLREVSVKLQGPFLRGPPGSYNLPTSAEFGFTFVHRPGHGSQFLPQPAYAQIVQLSLYNTMHLMSSPNTGAGADSESEVSQPASGGSDTYPPDAGGSDTYPPDATSYQAVPFIDPS